MKLRNKLIPIAAAMSTVAVVAPSTLTSCGHRYTDMLHEYLPGVTPFIKTTFEDAEAAHKTYTYRAMQNPDIIRDDVLFSISSIFNNKTTRDKINPVAEFTRYDLDLYFYTEKNKIDDQLKSINLAISLDVAGEGKTLEILERKIGKFDLSMSFVLYNISSFSPYFITADYKAVKGNDALKDYYLVLLPLDADVGEITTSGVCEGMGGNDKDEYNTHVIFNGDSTDDVEQYALFKMMLFTLCLVDVTIDPSMSDEGILFGSHYFKDVTIKSHE